MKPGIDVSVVIPTRNRCPLLRRSVASVLAQTHRDFELIVVDDASDDETWQWLGEVPDRRLVAFRLQQASERSAARNRGLVEARGRYIMFLDDDDHLLPSALASMLEGFKGNAQAIAVAGRRIDNDNLGRRAPDPHPGTPRTLPIWLELAAGWGLAQGQYLCLTEAVRSVGGWDEALSGAEDIDFWCRLSKLGEVAFIPSEVVCIEHTHELRPFEPPDNAQACMAIRQAFVATLSKERGDIGSRVLRIEALEHKAREGYYAGEFVHALKCYWRLYRLAPEVMRSPILGPSVRAAVYRAVAGFFMRKPGLRLAKSVLKRLP